MLASMNIYYFEGNSKNQNYGHQLVYLSMFRDFSENNAKLRACLRAQCYSAFPRIEICPDLPIGGEVHDNHLTIYVHHYTSDYIIGDMDHVIYITGDQLAR